jgi:hypothetical protein
MAGLDHSGDEPAARYRYRDGIGDVGVIPSVTAPFCESCDRVRITAEGKFKTGPRRGEVKAPGPWSGPRGDPRLRRPRGPSPP